MLGLMSSPEDMPLALQDEDINRGNKKKAVLKANYREAGQDDPQCKDCKYYDQNVEGVEEGNGYCELWEFSCAAENVCDAWESPESEDQEGEEFEETYGGS